MEAFYKALRQIYGPSSNGCSPLLSKDGKTLITDKPGILDHMREHVSDLLNKPPSLSADALQGIEQQPVDEELGLPPSMEEIRVAVRQLQRHLPVVYSWEDSCKDLAKASTEAS